MSTVLTAGPSASAITSSYVNAINERAKRLSIYSMMATTVIEAVKGVS